MKKGRDKTIDKTPKSDVIFKILFGSQKHPRLLLHLLNSIVDTKSPIKKVEVEQTELTPEFISQRGVRLDILATTDAGEKINIEIQKKDERNMRERSLFHWSRIFSGQAVVSEKYENLKRTVCINILAFRLFDDDRYWHKNLLMDTQTKEKLTDLLEIHFLELKKIKKRPPDSPILFWLEFIDNPESNKIKSMYHLEPVYEEAKRAYEEALADPSVREMIRIREKAKMDYNSAISRATEEGEKKGLKKAEKILKKAAQEKAKLEREKVKAEREKAKAEREKVKTEREKSKLEREKATLEREKVAMAKDMLSAGLSIDQVSQISGIPVKQLKSL